MTPISYEMLVLETSENVRIPGEEKHNLKVKTISSKDK